ncbi:MAG: OmpA family protein [Acidobacteriia bacterium]|nr:OmpA family protein [Terriglobia bacterium]
MKTQTLIALLLSTGLVLPAFAQQTSSNSSAPQPVTATEREPLPAPTPQDFWDGEEPGVAALLMHPFATKQYVKRHVEPIHDRLNELDELTTSNQQMIRDVDSRAQHGIQLASEKTSLADAHAVDATNKAQMAHQAAAALDTRVSAVETKVGNIDQYKSGSQTEIRFRPGQTVLSKQAKDALDQMASQLKSQHGYILEVQGFSSGQGQTAIANSRKMADSVVRYLVLNHEIPTYRIYVLGMGNASADKHASGTRVEVSLLKNDLEQTAKQ